MKFCPECGNELVPNAKFCPECGYKILQNANTNVEDTKSSVLHKKKVSSEQYIISFLTDSHLNNISVIPKIPENKLINASASIAEKIDPNIIIGLIDLSTLSNGKAGICFTGTDIYLKTMFNKPQKISLKNLDRVDYSIDMEMNNSGKEVEIHKIQVVYSDSSSIVISSEVYGLDVPYQLLADMLEDFNDRVDQINARSQVIQLGKMSNEIIMMYFRIIITYLKSDDGIVDTKEYKELLSLMTKVKVSKEIAAEIRSYRFTDREKLTIIELIDDLKCLLDKDNISETAVLQALGFDIIGLHYDELDELYSNKALTEMLNHLEMTDKQIQFNVRKLKAERKIILEKLDDKQIGEITSELAAVASAAGVSLGALAITGAVTGWGAGITGGLWAISVGSGGALLGLAAVASAGYGAYKGVKYFSGTGQMEKFGIRINTLNTTISNLRLSQSYVFEDINYLTQKLVEYRENLKEKQGVDQALFEELNQIISQSQSVANVNDLIETDKINMELDLLLMNLPEELIVGKYNELLANNIHKVHYDELIKEVYIFAGEVEDENAQYHALLRDDTELEKLEMVYGILGDIGYFDTATATIAQGKSLMKKGLKGLRKSFTDGDKNGE